MVTTLTRMPGNPIEAAPLQPTLWGSGNVSTNPRTAQWQHLDHESSILHQHRWIDGADRAVDELIEGLAWVRAERRAMYDRIVDVPRLNLMLDRTAVECHAAPASFAIVDTVVAGVEALVGTRFDRIGINYYRDGQDSVAWHRDQIGPDRRSSVIALVSLGGPRELRLRPFRRADNTSTVAPSTRHNLTMHSGDLVVMAGACQRDWEHAVPKVSSASPRISIVLRTKRSCEGPLFDH